MAAPMWCVTSPTIKLTVFYALIYYCLHRAYLTEVALKMFDPIV